jgi:acetyl-CoA acetyltransferase
VVVAAAVRSAVGRRGGGLSQVHPSRLLGTVQRAAVRQAGVDPALVGQVIGGVVAQVGEQSFDVTRTAWLAEGLPQEVPATTIDAQCGSSQQAVTLAAGLIGSGITDVALACGVESMSRIPIGANYRKELGLGRPVPRAYRSHYEFLNQFQAAEPRGTASAGTGRTSSGISPSSALLPHGREGASTASSSPMRGKPRTASRCRWPGMKACGRPARSSSPGSSP